MPYISELLNNNLTDSTDASVGKLSDILISSKEGSFPPLEFLQVKNAEGKFSFVPYEAVANFTGSQIALKTQFVKVALPDLPQKNYTYLKRDVLDKQIVDVAGTRVVRVNDLRIGNFENKICVLGIDDSFRGLLRRLGFNSSRWDVLTKVHLIDWRQAQLIESKGQLHLNTVADNLGHLHPADLANIVEDLDVKQGSTLLASLDEREAAKVFEELDPELQNIFAKYLAPEKTRKILAQMSVDEVVDLVKSFSSDEARNYLSQVNHGKAEKIAKLMNYPDNTAGGLMTLDFISVRPNWTVEQVVGEIRKNSEMLRSIVHIYVTEEDGKFVGAVSTRRLLLASKDQVIKSLAKGFVTHSTLKPADKVEKIIKLMTKYNLYTAAVIDREKKLLGVVTIDDVMRQLYPAA